LPGIAISLVSLVAVFYFADLNKLRDALLLADVRLLVLAVGVTIIWLLVRALFWRTLLQEKASYPAVFWTMNEGYLLNNLLPFRLGEIARAFILSRKAPVGFWEVLSTIILERILDLTMALGLLFITLPFVVGGRNQVSFAVVIAVGGVLVLATLYILARNREWTIGVFNRFTARFPRLQKLGGNALPAFLDGLAVFTDGKRFLRATFLVILDWIIAVTQYHLVINAFVPDATPLWSGFTLAVTALGIAAPSSPGALGVFEAAVVASLALFRVDASTALAAAITAHLVQVLVTGVLGVYGLVIDGESLAGLYRRVRTMSSKPQV
jgi:uncharacterized protein (TIRG00374 family)